MVGAWQDRDFFYAHDDEKKNVLYGVLEYDLTPDAMVSAGLSDQRTQGNRWFMGQATWDDFGFLGLDRGRTLNTRWSDMDQEITDIFAAVEHRINPDWTLKFSAMKQVYDSDTLRISPTGPVSRDTGQFQDVFARYEAVGNRSRAAGLSLEGQFDMFGRQHKLLVGADWCKSHVLQEM